MRKLRRDRLPDLSEDAYELPNSTLILLKIIRFPEGVNLTQSLQMPRNYWLVKQEPESYSWDSFVKDGAAVWTGVRNYQARNNLRSMKLGDLVLYYHSVSEKRVVGVAQVTREHYPDPTAEEGDWSVVDLAPVKALRKPVTLEDIKADDVLKDIPLVKNSRLSVSPLSATQFNKLLKLAGTKL